MTEAKNHDDNLDYVHDRLYDRWGETPGAIHFIKTPTTPEQAAEIIRKDSEAKGGQLHNDEATESRDNNQDQS